MNDADFIARMNGDLFIPNDSGEADIGHADYVVSVHSDPAGAVYGTLEQMRYMASEIQHQSPALSNVLKNTILACRMGAWKLGLLDGDVTPAYHNCRYTEVVHVAHGPGDAIPVAQGWIDRQRIFDMSRDMVNLICFCAYIFRWRGHHYKAEYLDDITAKWAKNLNCPPGRYTQDMWEHILTKGFHCIFPDVLDNFYQNRVAAGECCRPFALRVDVACAGTAPFFALLAGVREAELILPGAIKRVEADVERLRLVCTDLHNNRWKGGVNRAYYGGAPLNIKESDFSALAAIVYGINTPTDNITPLGMSQSLGRVAGNAPLTTLIVRSTATGILRRCMAGEVQSSLGDKALKQIVFAPDAQP